MANHLISSTFQGGVIIAEFINMKTLVYNIYFLLGVSFSFEDSTLVI